MIGCLQRAIDPVHQFEAPESFTFSLRPRLHSVQGAYRGRLVALIPVTGALILLQTALCLPMTQALLHMVSDRPRSPRLKALLTLLIIVI